MEELCNSFSFHHHAAAPDGMWRLVSFTLERKLNESLEGNHVFTMFTRQPDVGKPFRKPKPSFASLKRRFRKHSGAPCSNELHNVCPQLSFPFLPTRNITIIVQITDRPSQLAAPTTTFRNAKCTEHYHPSYLEQITGFDLWWTRGSPRS